MKATLPARTLLRPRPACPPLTSAARRSALLGLSLLLAACATPAESGSEPGSIETTATKTVEKTTAGLGEAALSPLEDLNIKRDEIPPLLKEAASPYDMEGVADLSCADLALRIAELNLILGNDWDVPVPDEEEMTDAEKAEKRSDQASEATLGYISSEARGFFPFRGAVRYITGASKHEKELAKAYAIGAQRRAFLKGVGLVKGCEPPAAPNPVVETEPKIIFKGTRDDTPR